MRLSVKTVLSFVSFMAVSVCALNNLLNSQYSQQFRFADVLSFTSSVKLASGFLEFSNELQFHAMMLLLLNVEPLLVFIFKNSDNSWGREGGVGWLYNQYEHSQGKKFIFSTILLTNNSDHAPTQHYIIILISIRGGSKISSLYCAFCQISRCPWYLRGQNKSEFLNF